MVTVLAGELTSGVAPWRDAEAVKAAVRGWVRDAVADDGPQSPVWVVEADGEVVGFAAARISAHWTGQLDAYLGELVVDPRHRGQGLARRLLEAVEAWARDQGLEHVRIATGAANFRARGLYARAGYVEEDVVVTRRV